MSNNISVEIAFATIEKQIIKRIFVAENTPIVEVIKLSKIGNDFLEFDLSSMPYGIFGKKVDNEYLLRDGDRIEIYRALAKTPNQRRLERANK